MSIDAFMERNEAGGFGKKLCLYGEMKYLENVWKLWLVWDEFWRPKRKNC